MEMQQFCGLCGEGLPVGARFCGRCGAPTGRMGGVPRAGGAAIPPDPQADLTASDIVYLHGEFFAEKGNWQTGDLVLESSGAKVQKKQLANTLILAALASLVKDRWIEVAMVNVGILLSSKAPVIRKLSQELYPRGGLESALIANLRQHDPLNRVEQVVRRLVGGEQADPWEKVAGYVRAHLAETGYFPRVDDPAACGLGKLFHSAHSFEPNLSLISRTVGEIARVRSSLVEVRARDPYCWELAAMQVNQALQACLSKGDD